MLDHDLPISMIEKAHFFYCGFGPIVNWFDLAPVLLAMMLPQGGCICHRDRLANLMQSSSAGSEKQ